MGNQNKDISLLRQKLRGLNSPPAEELSYFLSDAPMMRGTVYTMRRRCGKPTCRCIQGALHETVVLTENVNQKTRLWKVPEDQLGEARECTERYRQFRRARRRFIQECGRRQKEMLRLIDVIAKARTLQL